MGCLEARGDRERRAERRRTGRAPAPDEATLGPAPAARARGWRRSARRQNDAALLRRQAHPGRRSPGRLVGRRVALDARPPSDLQRDPSIKDQLRVCRAERQGHDVAEGHDDRATSGATMMRPGLQANLASARAGRIDRMLAEALGRLSRNFWTSCVPTTSSPSCA